MPPVEDKPNPTAPQASPPGGQRDPLPLGAKWFLGFQALNAFSFNIALGAPLILLAKHIGASEKVIGLLIGLTPLMACLQLLATNIADKWGYKRLILLGWSLRAFMFLPIAAIPLLSGRLPDRALVWILIVCILLFTTIRGAASGAWWPWIRLIVPHHQRGRYLGVDQLVFQIFVLISMLSAGWILGDSPEGWRYTIIYILAWASAMVSQYFLSQVPCPMPPEAKTRPSRTLIDVGRAMKRVWAHPPFRQATRYAGVHGLAYAAVGGFLIVFLREDMQFSEGLILKLAAGQTIGMIATSMMWGSLSDKTGSRPLMRLALGGYMAVLAVLGGAALGWVSLSMWLMGGLYVLFGFFDGAHGVPQSRLALASCPDDELTVGMAFYQVVVALTRGGSALLWGLSIELLRHTAIPPFIVFFWGIFAITLAAQFLLTRVREPEARRTKDVIAMIFWQWPQRMIDALPWAGGGRGVTVDEDDDGKDA